MSNTGNASHGVSEDWLLGGRVRISQPVQGYRAAIDPVLLAASIPATDGEHVLDLGVGAGAAALCLLSRVLDARATGIDKNAFALRLSRENAAHNHFSERFTAIEDDIFEASALKGAMFHHVMTNPPFHDDGSHTLPASPEKSLAHHMPRDRLGAWIDFGLRRLKPGGTFTIIHRADALQNILGVFDARLGALLVLPVATKPGQPAKRVIVQGVKGRKSPLRLLAPFIVHDADGAYTNDAEGILRGAQPLLHPQA